MKISPLDPLLKKYPKLDFWTHFGQKYPYFKINPIFFSNHTILTLSLSLSLQPQPHPFRRPFRRNHAHSDANHTHSDVFRHASDRSSVTPPTEPPQLQPSPNDKKCQFFIVFSWFDQSRNDRIQDLSGCQLFQVDLNEILR